MPQQTLYIYSEAEILKQKFIEQQQQYIKQQHDISKNPALGPGAYNPDYKKVKKAAPSTDWATSKAQRVNEHKTISANSPKKKKDPILPGPGAYNAGTNTLIGGNA